MTPDTLAELRETVGALRAAVKAPSPGDAEADDALPSAAGILGAALDETGLREGYEAGAIDDAERRDLLRAVTTEGERWCRAEGVALMALIAPDSTKALFGGVKAAVDRFIGRLGKGIREIITAGVLALVGPDASVVDDPTVQEALAVEVERQQQYLDAFRDRIVSEAKPLDNRIVSNAEQFGASTWGTAQEVARQRMVAAGKTEARRVLGQAEHCGDCPPLADLGWQPIASVPPIGFKDLDGNPTECMMRCECWIEVR